MMEPMSSIRGTVRTWRDEEGYGFIGPDDSGDDVFFHITAVSGRRRPRTGQRARFRVQQEKGRDRAVDVRLSGIGIAPTTALALGVLIAAGGAVALAVTETVPVPWPLLVYAVMSLIAFTAHALDKHRARHGGRRIPEATLHLLELLGGWPGALVAMSFFRHKTRKTSYRVVFWLIGMAHAAAWFILWREGMLGV